jgi:nucleoside-diphosphate-sugar epimerase
LTALGWRARTPLDQGIAATYRAYLAGEVHARSA